jgi:ribonucleoside-triphosphate reductase
LYTLDHQESLQQKYTGGTVLHLYAAEKIPSGEICKRIIKSTFEHYKIPYLTISPTFSICNIHGYLNGEQKICPKCGEECEVWSRIVGYMRPVSGWNDGKKMEFADRLKVNYRAAIEGKEKNE